MTEAHPRNLRMQDLAKGVEPTFSNVDPGLNLEKERPSSLSASLPSFEGDEPTEEERATLRCVSDKLPWAAFLVAVIELCERFAYYGLSGPFQNYIQHGYHESSGLPGALGRLIPDKSPRHVVLRLTFWRPRTSCCNGADGFLPILVLRYAGHRGNCVGPVPWEIQHDFVLCIRLSCRSCDFILHVTSDSNWAWSRKGGSDSCYDHHRPRYGWNQRKCFTTHCRTVSWYQAEDPRGKEWRKSDCWSCDYHPAYLHGWFQV